MPSRSAIGTAKDISEIADDIDNLFLGEKQIQRRKSEAARPIFSRVCGRETIDAKLAQEQMYEVKPAGRPAFRSRDVGRHYR